MIKRTSALGLATRMSLVFFVMLMPINACPDSGQTIAEADVRELLTLSGMEDQLMLLPDAVVSSFEQSLESRTLLEPFQTADLPRIRRFLETAFSTEPMMQTMQDRLELTLEASQISDLIGFYRGQTGRQIRSAEVANTLLSNRQRFETWQQSTGLQMSSPRRKRLIHEIERLLQATGSAVDTLINMQVALQISLTPVLPGKERQSAVQLIRTAEQQRPLLLRIYRESSLQSLAFIYHDLSEQTLEEFVDILGSDSGRQYVGAVNQALNKGMLDAAESLGQAMKPLLTQRLGREV